MTVREAQRVAVERLKASGVIPADFEARQLLSGIVPEGDFRSGGELDGEGFRRFEQRLERRLSGEPLQYILGEWEFYSLPFCVGEGVLIPRADTELLVDLALGFLKSRPRSKVADLCTGSGCIAIAVAKNAPEASVTAFELSGKAITYFEKNRAINGANVKLVRGDVLKNTGGDEFDLILSNPPYIPTGDLAGLDREVRREPTLALDGGADGLTFYRAIAEIWVESLAPGGAIMVEVGAGEADAVADIFRAAGLCGIASHKDINGIDRVVTCVKAG